MLLRFSIAPGADRPGLILPILPRGTAIVDSHPYGASGPHGPYGLANLSGIELWERFSFYGVQGLLAYCIYYAVGDGGLGFTPEVAASIVGAYGGLVYASAILGGWVSDRLLGVHQPAVHHHPRRRLRGDVDRAR